MTDKNDAASSAAITTLQGFVDRFTTDVATVKSALEDAATPRPAKLLLAGALSYVLDPLDIFPDHYKGLGLADDVIVLRAAARQALAAGSPQPALRDLAGEMNAVEEQILGDDLAGPFDALVATLPARSVRGRTAEQILTSQDAHAIFDADIGRELQSQHPTQIDTTLGTIEVLAELRRMVRSALKKGAHL